MSKPFQLGVRVYIEDTDAGGIVFYANYLKYFERARTEFVRSLGIGLRQGLTNNINYVVHSVDLKYIKPAYLDDELNISAEIIELGKTFMVFKQVASTTSGQQLVVATIKVACVHLDTGKPRRIDVLLHETLSGQIENN